MSSKLMRTLLIYFVLLVAVVQVYPTIGWMTLSDSERQTRLAQWEEEDRNTPPQGFIAETLSGLKRWAKFDRDRVIDLGLDLQGGVNMIVGIEMDKVDPKRRQEMLDMGYTEDMITSEMQETVVQTIRRRVFEFETKEPRIQPLGDTQVLVQLPGEKDVQRAVDLIKKTAVLEFQIVSPIDDMVALFSDLDAHFNGDFVKRLTRPIPSPSMGVLEVAEEQLQYVREMVAKAEAENLIPADKEIAFSSPPSSWETNMPYLIYVLEKEPLMTGDMLTDALARPDDQTGGASWMIYFSLSPSAGRDFQEKTSQNIDRHMAIVVDNLVESAPVIRDAIGTDGTITGSFTADEAKDLAIALKSGSLPVPIKEDMAGYIGPTLGEDSIRKGVSSSLIGLAVVMVFMIIYYRLTGIVANVGLAVNALLIIGLMAYTDTTLTLPGIAGLILTIGMAVDANVLIFERIREELSNGKSLRASVDSGFERAQSAILDSNITTLIAAAVLMQFGSGPIEGFAITLSIGVVTSVFAALVVSRAMFDFMLDRGIMKSISMMSAFKPNAQIPFLNYGKQCVAVSIAVIVISMGYFVFRGEANFGVEFKTGTNMIVNLKTADAVDVAKVRSTLTDAGFKQPDVTSFEQDDAESANRFLVQIGQSAEEFESGGAGQGMAQKVQSALQSLGGEVALEKVDTVGPAVGQRLKLDALEAIAYSFFFIIIYLWVRFEWRFATAAVVAVFHDVLVTLGFLALFQREISLTVVAAILTIIGYSLNDTIIIFDRVREDLKLYRGRGYSYPHIFNISINQTLSRTILTSVTTLFVVVVLFVFGGDVINDFAFALMVGMAAGIYSTVFVASPVVMALEKFFPSRTGPSLNEDDAKTGGKRRNTKGGSEGDLKKSKSGPEEAHA
ncbi:MAG: protein translocase subunit SecDF [Candidatus Hydrogenedentota bacterium]